MKIYMQFGFLAMIVMCSMADEDPDYQPTITEEDVMKILKCISPSKNQTLCDEFMACVMSDTKKVVDSYIKCNKEINPDPESTECNETNDLHPPGVASKIFDCMEQNTEPLTDDEMKQSQEADKCTREVYKKCQDSTSQKG